MTPSAVLPAADRLPLRLDDGDAGYRLVRAWPRSPQHMLLEWERSEEGLPSETVVGQWFADPTALAGMLHVLATDPWLRERVGRAARAHVMSGHTWTHVVERSFAAAGLALSAPLGTTGPRSFAEPEPSVAATVAVGTEVGS